MKPLNLVPIGTPNLRAIAQKVAADEKYAVTISHDWGFGSATVELPAGHTHIGSDDGTDAERLASFIDGMYALLIEGRGLSLA